jgi:putative DNA primase/helicase
MLRYLKRLGGYILTGVTTEPLIAFGHGSGANGKTTFVNALAGILGSYARAVPAETFLASKQERHPTEIANLMGARLIIASEIGRGRTWNESRLNELTGGDRVAARFMRGDFFEFTPVFKLLIVGNHKPSLQSTNEAIRRRLHLLPFAVTIPPAHRDTKLAEKLKAEWPGILRWLIEGCLEWQREGLNPPPEVRAATQDYLADEDLIGRWLEECTVRAAQDYTASAALYTSFKAWAEAAHEYVVSKKALTQALQEKGFRESRKATSRGFIGLRLRSPETLL